MTPTVGFTIRRKLAMRTAKPSRRYTQGFCGEFAIAASLLSGYPIVVLHERGDPCGYHAMVLRGKWLYDVRGWQTWQDVRRNWLPWKLARVRRVTIKQLLNEDGWDVQLPEVLRAIRYIRRYRS